MSFQRATTPPRRSTTVWPQGSRTARKFRSYLEDPCAQPAPTPNSAKPKPSLGNPQATGYAGVPSGALWNAQQGTEKQSIFEPSNVPTLATRHESTTRSSSGPCFEHEVSLATNIAHAARKEADATVSAAQKLWGKADPRIYSPSMHGIETMPFDDVDSLTLEAELPRNHAMPRMPFYAGMEAERSTLAQTGSETRPSAEGPRPLELGSDGWRLRRLEVSSGKERKTPVLDMGSVYQGPYEDRYLAANQLYAFYWPIGLSTTCHTGKDPKLEVTNTVLEGKAGPMFQASCKPAEPGLCSPKSHVHTFESDTNHIAWDLIFKAIGCTGLKKGAPCDTVLFGLSDSRVQEHLYLKWNAAQRRCIDQYEYDNEMGNRVGYRTTPEEVLKRGSSSSTRASIKANKALVLAANKAAREAGNMQGSQLVQGAHAAAGMEDPEWQPSSEDDSDSGAEALNDIGGGAPPVRRKVATDVDAGGQTASATAPGIHVKMASSYVYLQEIQGKLCTADRQAAVMKSLQTQHKLMLQHLDDDFAVLELLRAQVVDAACDDPASLILPHLVIPLLRDRMEALERDTEGGTAVLGGSWDPMWPRDVLATQYRQKPVNISCKADMTLQLLQVHLEAFVQLLGLLGIQDTHVTFVDDLLFPEDHILQSAVFGAEMSFLGCCRCMATLLFFS